MLRRITPFIAALLLTLPLPAHAKDKLSVVATFSIIADLAIEVGGDKVEVQSLVPAGGDVHVYEPSPRDARLLAKADVILVNGLGFEHWIDKLVESSGAKAPVVVVSKGIIPLTVNGGEVDPHAWQDISNGMIYVDRIRDAFVQADPENARYYRAHAAHYLEQLIMLDDWVKARIDELPAGSRRAITSHDALHYFVRTYHIELTPAQGLSTEGELSAQGMAAIIDQIRRDHVKALFLENMSNPQLIEQLAEDSGVKIGGTLYSDSLSDSSGDGSTYILMFKHNVKTLTDALKK